MTLVWKSGYSFDSDASTYIDAVETADGQALETGVRIAINDFVLGCKQDGIWNAIKASCILAGARTLDGALVQLVGTAPTKQGTEVDWNYNRVTGLQGNGTNNYLDSNRLDNADPQNDSHRSVYATTPGTQTFDAYIGVVYTLPTRQSYIARATDLGGRMIVTERGGSGGQTDLSGQQNASGFIGQSRKDVASYSARVSQNTNFLNDTSTSALAANSFVFARNFNGSANIITNARLAFYSIGESLDLALLDTRVSNLITAIGAAIP